MNNLDEFLPPPAPPVNAQANAMSVDVEDYFQVQAFAGVVKREDWDSFASRVADNTLRILDQFARFGASGTFFTLGWVAERHPALIRRIVAAGHELASHGYGHAPVYEIGEDGFRADIRRAKSILEDAGGVAIRGYRAPTFSIGPHTPWAHRVLEEEGHRYSSSTFPIRHDLYGDPDAPRFPYRPAGTAALWELPMTTVRLRDRNLPCAGGGYFRLMPYALYRLGLRRVNAGGHAGIFYFHPWEVDPGQPRIGGTSRMARFRHTVNLAAMAGRLDRLLGDFTWRRIDQVFAATLAEG